MISRERGCKICSKLAPTCCLAHAGRPPGVAEGSGRAARPAEADPGRRAGGPARQRRVLWARRLLQSAWPAAAPPSGVEEDRPGRVVASGVFVAGRWVTL